MAGDMSDKVKENYLRRQAKRLGLWLQKSRAKKWSLHNQCGYTIIDPYKNTCVWGPDCQLDLNDVEQLLNEYEEKIKSSPPK